MAACGKAGVLAATAGAVALVLAEPAGGMALALPDPVDEVALALAGPVDGVALAALATPLGLPATGDETGEAPAPEAGTDGAADGPSCETSAGLAAVPFTVAASISRFTGTAPTSDDATWAGAALS